MLRSLAIAAGICCSILFIVIGLRYQLQIYGDGAIFSYAVAVQDAWAFHWHNIPGRLTVFLVCLAPAQAFVALTGSPGGGVLVYGLLSFAAPLLGLIATYAADRSQGRIIFGFACFSTAALCPLVFGFPTEMWLAHALFWPTLAVSHYARRGIGESVLVFALFLALVFTHEGAIIFAATIVVTLLPRGPRDAAFVRAACALAVAIVIWAAIKVAFPPDNYIAGILARAARNFFDIAIFSDALVLLLLSAFVGYGVAFLILSRFTPANAHVGAAAIVALALAIYWLKLDHALHATDRYFMRTVLLLATLALGSLAALYALRAEGRLKPPAIFDSRLLTQAIVGSFLVLLLVHAVETAKFVTAWVQYKSAIEALATGAASDPSLSDPNFVSSGRIDKALNRLSWNSTTPYLSVILAKFAPARLVVDPTANYFWLSCETATANFKADRAVPVETRGLVRIHACLHR